MQLGKIEAERACCMQVQRAAHHLCGHERIAIAVAADPASQAEEGRHRDLRLRPARAQQIFDLAIQPRQLLQEGVAVISQPILDFIGDGQAQLAQNLETERKGERFTLIEPPLQPQEPVKPNRPAILLLGLVFAAAAALVLMFVLETLDTRIRDRSHLIALLAVPPLAVIPAQDLEEDVEARRHLRRKTAMLTAALFVLVLIGVHLFIQPLDIVWLRLMRRLGA